MLSIVATLIIGLSSVLVYFVDESQTAFGVSFCVLICSCAITLHSDYWKDDAEKLTLLKYYGIASMALLCFHLVIAGIRLGKYYHDGDRFAIITLVNCVAGELFLIYSLVCAVTRLMALKKSSKERAPLTNQPIV